MSELFRNQAFVLWDSLIVPKNFNSLVFNFWGRHKTCRAGFYCRWWERKLGEQEVVMGADKRVGEGAGYGGEGLCMGVRP